MARPSTPPIGLNLARSAKLVSRAFDDALASAGGSTSTWLVLIALKTQPGANQRTIAEAVGIQGATLTHHLNAMESAELLARRRDPANRRMHLVELTDAGERLFHELRKAAAAFDRRLRNDLGQDDIDRLEELLAKLVENATGAAGGAASAVSAATAR
jgi:MarR family transcriptional regulator, transcriptional regulator for hemolysin